MRLFACFIMAAALGCTASIAGPSDEECDPRADDCNAAIADVGDSNQTCEEHADCGTGGTCIDGFCSCNVAEMLAEPIPANVLVVLDKSGSMRDDGKWNSAVQAMNNMLANFSADIHFGLTLFPRNDSCGDGRVVVPIEDPDAALRISQTLGSTSPDGGTPMGDTLNDMLSYSALQDPTRNNYVLLITDGIETCGGNAGKKIDAFRALPEEVKTFVIGFGYGVDANQLSNLAERGGTAKATGSKYYQANSQFELVQALDAIAYQAGLSCRFTVEVEDPSKELDVLFDGLKVPEDKWVFDPMTSELEFLDTACDDLRTGAVEQVKLATTCLDIVD